MTRVIFNIAKLQTKLLISIIVVIVFIALYKTVPATEFGKESVSNFDIIYYSLLTHMGIQYNKFLDPLSLRARILSVTQLIIGYIVFIM